MKPPYDVSVEILDRIASISEKLGGVKANYLNKLSPQFRKTTKIKTIHSSLNIEVFEYIPFETLINDSQEEYYTALKVSDKEGKSTRFIEYMLSIIDNSLDDVIVKRSRKLSGVERIRYYGI